jgi:putative ABC transport system permease protein
MLLSQTTGFRTEQVLRIDLSSPSGTRELDTRRAQFHSQLLERLAALPGVESAGGVNRFPLGSGYGSGSYVKALGDEQIDDASKLSALFRDPARTGHAEFRIASGV